MFAARVNQENAIYTQQTAAAAKPLNQGVKGLAPKTPGNKAPKTPFNRQHNDENAAKTGGKGKQDGLFGEGKGGKVDKSAFLTPAGPRNRAPLGNKTTNAKATAFQTPAPPSAQPTSPRMRRAKIKVHEAEPETQDDHEEREIEYMPPREIPLPDLPEDDWPIDRTCPQFEGKNLTCGWYTEYMARKKDDDEDDEFSDFEQKLKRIEELNEKKKQAQQAKKGNVVKKTALHKTTRDPLALKPAQSLTARGAASALSSTEPTPSFAAPTAAAKARLPSALQSKKVSALTATGDTRHTAAKVASNSTLGYSKGRAVSASARAPLSSIHERPTEASAPRPSFAQCSLNELFGHQNLDIKDEDADLGLGDSSNDLGEEEGGVQVFQLDTVEL